MSGIPEATAILLTAAERTELEGLVRSTKTEHRLRQRARIVLLASEGLASRAIGRAVGCTTGTASKWRVRYAEKRFGGLDETGDRGAEPKYTAETGKRILALLDQPKPKGYARWSGPLLAAALGDVDVQYVWRFLRAQKIDLAGRKSWCESNDPEFAAKAADVVGLYMAPPENAIVLCVDEKPSIQALERAQGYLKMPNGRALGGHSHDYKRNGTSTLFAAFEVATGKVTAAHKKRRRRIEFLDFMNDIVAAWPDTAIHVVLDNLNTHKPRNDRWLKLHSNVTFHFTPTRASWLNQVEIWFSILQAKSLCDESFTSVKQLRDHIDNFIDDYNANAKPFVWTKSEVHQKRLKALEKRAMRKSPSCLADGSLPTLPPTKYQMGETHAGYSRLGRASLPRGGKLGETAGRLEPDRRRFGRGRQQGPHLRLQPRRPSDGGARPRGQFHHQLGRRPVQPRAWSAHRRRRQSLLHR